MFQYSTTIFSSDYAVFLTQMTGLIHVYVYKSSQRAPETDARPIPDRFGNNFAIPIPIVIAIPVITVMVVAVMSGGFNFQYNYT